MSLVASAGIGLVAIIVDIVAVGLRRPALAGVPLLVLFSVPVASNLKTFSVLQTATFAAGLAGYLGAAVSRWQDSAADVGPAVTFRYVQPADETGEGQTPGNWPRQAAASGWRPSAWR